MNQIIQRYAINTLVAVLVTVMPAVIAAQDSGLTVEQRLQHVEDELAIQRVLVDYAATQDARDYDGYVALFAENGEWVNGTTVYKGREAIRKMLVSIYGEPPSDYVNNDSYHITSNAEINIDGDRATAHSRYLLMMRGANGQPVPMLGGRYEDEFIRDNGEWKILRRVDYPVMPTRDEWLQIIRARQQQNNKE